MNSRQLAGGVFGGKDKKMVLKTIFLSLPPKTPIYVVLTQITEAHK